MNSRRLIMRNRPRLLTRRDRGVVVVFERGASGRACGLWAGFAVPDAGMKTFGAVSGSRRKSADERYWAPLTDRPGNEHWTIVGTNAPRDFVQVNPPDGRA